MRWTGQVTDVVGLADRIARARARPSAISARSRTSGGRRIRTQVIGFRDGRVLSMPLEEIDGLQAGDPVEARSEEARVEVGPGLLGRVIDGFGKPIDGGPPHRRHATPTACTARPAIRSTASTSPSRWSPASAPSTACCPCGKGQRIGIFGGSGVGKSTLLGSMSRHNSADVTVIAMIGERNREVRGFLEHELGPGGPQALGGGGGHLRAPGAAARARLFRGAGGGRVLPRPGRRACCW